MFKIVYILFVSAFFVSLSQASECVPERVLDSFPVLEESLALENSQVLCSYYNSHIQKRKKCVLNAVAQRCDRISKPGMHMSFSECVSEHSRIFLSTILLPGSQNEKTACENFEYITSK